MKPGDEAVTSPLTFAATANCVLYQGATPIFADVSSDTLNLDPEKVVTVHNGLGSQWQPSRDTAQGNATREKYGLAADDQVILQVANASWYKNFSTLAEAFSLMKNPRTRLLKGLVRDVTLSRAGGR